MATDGDATGSGERTRSAVEQDPGLRLSVAGETVAATRYQPTEFDDRLPAVLWPTPYHKDDETTHGRYDPLLEYVAAHGYEVIVADLIGTGASTGYRESFMGPDTGAEMAGLVERVAELPWTTDRVALVGKSYPGVLCLAAAAENPDPLAAVVPIQTTHRRRHQAFDRGGLARLWLTVSIAALYQVSIVQPPSRRDAGWGENWHERLDRYRSGSPVFARLLDPDPDDPHWDWRIPVEDIEVPTFAVGSYRDHFTADTLEYFDAIAAPKRLLAGPWRHVIPYRGRETAVGFRGLVVDWVDRFLKDRAVEPFEPTIALWTQRDGGRRVDAGVWRGRETWPTLDAADALSFVATPDGLERSGGFDGGRVERTHELDHTIGLDAHDPSVPAVDTSADDARSLTFESAPVDRPLELTGTGEATVQLETGGPVALCVRLVDVAPSGRARPITRGSVRIEEAEAGSRTVGARTVEFAPVSHVLETGHRLRVAMAGADFPSHVPVDDGGPLVVSSTPEAPTTVRIPGRVLPTEPFGDPLPMPPPDDSMPLAPPAVADVASSLETCREHERGTATRRRSVASTYEFEHVTKETGLDVEATIAHDDPATLTASATLESVLDYGDETVTVASTVRRSFDGGSVTTAVDVDGEPVLEREWSS